MPAAVTDAYTDEATYRNRLKKSDAGDDPAILVDLTAVSRYIDRKCNRFFTKDTNAVARLYYPQGYYRGDPEAENPWRYVQGARTLWTDDIASTTSFAIVVDDGRDGSFSGDTAWASTDYQLMPLNADKGSEPKPWTSIYVPTYSTKSGFNPGSLVQVTAIWGWPAIPKSIVAATIQLTGILRLESPRATQRIPEAIDSAFEESETAKSIVAELISVYRRAGELIVA